MMMMILDIGRLEGGARTEEEGISFQLSNINSHQPPQINKEPYGGGGEEEDKANINTNHQKLIY